MKSYEERLEQATLAYEEFLQKQKETVEFCRSLRGFKDGDKVRCVKDTSLVGYVKYPHPELPSWLLYTFTLSFFVVTGKDSVTLLVNNMVNESEWELVIEE